MDLRVWDVESGELECLLSAAGDRRGRDSGPPRNCGG